MDSRRKDKDFEVLRRIGQGAYGTVYKVKLRPSGAVCALKKIKFPETEASIPATALREVAVLRLIEHPNIVRLLDVKLAAPRRKLYLFFEFIESDLSGFLKIQKPSFALMVSLTHQMLRGLHHLHSRRIMHRDIKPKNLLVSPETAELKIADFGLSRPFSLPLGFFSPEIQSLWYRAPEVLLGVENYSLSVDVWSAGCVAAELALGRPLFPGDSEFGSLVMIFSLLGTPPPNHPLRNSPFFSQNFPNFTRTDGLKELLGNRGGYLVELLERMLDLDPAERISVADALKSPLFNDAD